MNKSELFESGKYPVLNGGINPSGYYNEYNADENTIAISQGGASAGYVNFVKEKFWAGAHCYIIFLNSSMVLNKFLYYCLKKGQSILQNAKLGAGIPGLNSSELLKFPIPIPSISEQERIVSILDKFEKLVNDISEGLPAEIAARRQQYEHYRERLLTFKQL